MKEKIRALATRLHNEERGDIPVGQLAVIGLIIVPLVIGMIMFGEELMTWFRGQYDKLIGAEKPMNF